MHPPDHNRAATGLSQIQDSEEKYAEAFLESVFRQHAPIKPATAAVTLEITISHPLTKAQFKQGISVAPKLSRPDCDNYAKLILDAMTKTNYFNDDQQVYDLRIAKFNSAFPGIAVTLKETQS